MTTTTTTTMTTATHGGIFHADDVFAYVVLQLIYGGNIKVIRTRNPKILAECDVVFDVGGVYDPATKRFDHHQREGSPVPRPNGVKYSSFGLVWKKHGAEIAGEAAQAVDEILVQAVDASDNGQALNLPNPEFNARGGFSISAAVSSFNPGWDSSESFDAAFMRAVGFAGAVLRNVIASAQGRELACTLVGVAILEATNPRVVILDRFCPWVETVVLHAPRALFVVFPSETGDWRLQCVPDKLGGFGKRKPLPEDWGGLSGDALAGITGVPDAVFCHAGRFICGARSREGTLALARLALAD